MAASQGLFCIFVRVALVWIHSATASAVSFFLLLQVGLFAICATMSFWIFLGWPATCFFSALLRFGFGGLCCADSNKQKRFDVFCCGSTSTSFFVFVCLSSLSCLTSSGAFRARVFPLSLIAQTLHASIVQRTRVS